jgi:four helix bundle protein
MPMGNGCGRLRRLMPERIINGELLIINWTIENYKYKNKEMIKKNVIVDKSFDFALTIIELYTVLKDNKEYVISKQLLRSGTSIGANIEEGIGAFSKNDFTAKMGIALKEARESSYWLRLLNRSQMVKLDYSSYILKADELISILTAIVKTAQTLKTDTQINN